MTIWMHDGPEALRAEQERMAAAVLRHDLIPLGPGARLLCLDIQYVAEIAHVGAALWRWGEDSTERAWVGEAPAGAEYHPGLFCYREGPPLLALIQRLRAVDVSFDALVVDGHGVAHPRGLGVASWLGLKADLPSVGCAKRSLLPYPTEPSPPRGSRSAVSLEGETVGAVLRTVDGVKPLFVSVGHGVSLETACAVVMAMPGPYRLPNPLRAADQAARAHARGESSAAIELGELLETPA